MSETETRLMELEMHCTHLQKMLDDLHDVALSQTQRIDALQRQLNAISQRTDSLEHQLDTPRDAIDEKPPHY